ncbi:HTH_Tnp_Tc3_2 domain-containing protein [Trichonephila clavipes]|uniref:HTH_Tnp_Tc3_2 domain-containing protein n=1 Tax=Trichonephila clavipes TaxID=2585209 RepID=A0A8X6SIE3_TRICX|nr:HTH_Tnp_Tc3_2 domain-containing protein [Trichonephila clavipes]
MPRQSLFFIEYFQESTLMAIKIATPRRRHADRKPVSYIQIVFERCCVESWWKAVVMPRVRSRNPYQHVSDFDKGLIAAYWDGGLSYRSIAARVGRDPKTVSRIWNRWVQNGNTERRAGSRRPLSLAAEKTGKLSTWP